MSTGTTAGFDQWVGGVSPERDDPSRSEKVRNYRFSCILMKVIVFFNKSSSAVHKISHPYRPRPTELFYWFHKLK